MPITLKQVLGKRATVSIDIEGETLTVVYNASAYTPQMVAKVNAIKDAKEGDEQATPVLVNMLNEVIVDWDVMGDNGAKVPCNSESYMTLPFWFLIKVMDAINKDIAPNEDSPRKSASSF